MELPFGRAKLSQKQRVLIWTAIAVFLLLVFVLDVLTPRGFESDDLYLPLIVAVALFGRPRDVLTIAVAASVLDVVGFFPSPPGIATGWAIGNRALGLLSIWITASLVLATRRLWAANARLQTEIAQRKRAEEELRKALAAKDDFLGMVSHEMRTPLTAVIGIASLLDTPTVTITEPERAELVTEMRMSSERLAATIENMLTLARVEAGRKLEFAAVSLSTIIDEQVALHNKNHPGRRIRTREVEHTPNAMGSADYLRHVVANLLENAAKYSPEDTPIEIELRREGDEIIVRVLDRGVGLTEDEVGHVFEAFYRSPRIASGSSGMGIGLSVCKRLIEEQGGHVWALPRPEGGSEFGFSLPKAG